jgi:hypothetical protein
LNLGDGTLGGGRRVESRWTSVGGDWLRLGLGGFLSLLGPLGLVSGSSRSSNCWILVFLFLSLFGQQLIALGSSSLGLGGGLW